MDLQLKRHADELEHIEPAFTGESGDAEPQSGSLSTNVVVSYGIHQGSYPIAGMTVHAARRALQDLINIDPSAVAVINGSPVDENQQIAAEVTMLAFVKPSAMKG